MFSVHDDLYRNSCKKITIDLVIFGTTVHTLDKQGFHEPILEIKKGAHHLERAWQDYINKLRIIFIEKEIDLCLCKHPQS